MSARIHLAGLLGDDRGHNHPRLRRFVLRQFGFVLRTIPPCVASAEQEHRGRDSIESSVWEKGEEGHPDGRRNDGVKDESARCSEPHLQRSPAGRHDQAGEHGHGETCRAEGQLRLSQSWVEAPLDRLRPCDGRAIELPPRDVRGGQVPESRLIVRTTFPVFCFVSTYLVASTTCSSG